MGKKSNVYLDYYDEDEDLFGPSKNVRKKEKKHRRRQKNTAINQIKSDYLAGVLADEDLEDLGYEIVDEEFGI